MTASDSRVRVRWLFKLQSTQAAALVKTSAAYGLRFVVAVRCCKRERDNRQMGTGQSRFLRGFGAVIGRDSACGGFGHVPGICVVSCKGAECPNARHACLELWPHCTGVALNAGGTLATLKSNVRWSNQPPPSVRRQSWWRQDECRSIKREARRLQDAGQRRLAPRYSLTEWKQSSERSLVERWRNALCNEYTYGPLIGRLGPSRPAADGVNAHLVIDVGFADGSDSAMFLRRGFHVVAIEADPATIKRARTRHPVIGLALSRAWRNTRYGHNGTLAQLAIENVAIADGPGVLTFYSPAGQPDLASIHQSTCERTQCRTLRVPTNTCASLFAKHGTPLVLKIDIEGADMACLRSLRGRRVLPPFIAIEDNNAIDLLVSMGYTRFKLVAGRTTSMCDRLPEAGAQEPSFDGAKNIGNSLGGMPWECKNTVPGMDAASWATANQTRTAQQFNYRGGGWDLYAWKP